MRRSRFARVYFRRPPWTAGLPSLVERRMNRNRNSSTLTRSPIGNERGPCEASSTKKRPLWSLTRPQDASPATFGKGAAQSVLPLVFVLHITKMMFSRWRFLRARHNLNLSGSTYDSRPELIQPEPQSFLAFDRVPLDQRQVHSPRPAESRMYIPISLGGLVLILVIVWLVRG